MGEVVIKTALDIGSSKVKAIVGELSGDGSKIRVIASTELPSCGVRKAKVEDVEALSEVVKTTISSLMDIVGFPIDKVSIGIGGNHIKSTTKNMKYSFGVESEVIKEDHYKKLFDLAEMETLDSENILKKELYNIRVDNSGILKSPLGLSGNTLEGDVHLITVDKAQQELLIEAVNRAGFEVENITLNPYAAAQSVLTDEDKKMGVALVDIGEGSTDIIIFKNDKLIYAKSIPIGGMHYINDLSYMFKLDKRTALKLRDLYEEKKAEEAIELEVEGELKAFSIKSIRDVIDARSGDIVNYLSKALEDSGFKGYLGNGVILTGGATTMDDVVEELAKNLNYKVKIGYPIKIRGMEDAKPSHSAVLGILLEALMKEDQKQKEHEKEIIENKDTGEDKPVESQSQLEEEPKSAKNSSEDKGPGFFSKVKGWIDEFI